MSTLIVDGIETCERCERPVSACYCDDIHAVVTWKMDDGSTFEWPQATVDNRPSRVIARMECYGFVDETALATLHIEHIKGASS